MWFTSRREQRLWSAAGLCVALIYSSLYLARPIAEFLRDRNLLRLAVAIVFLTGAALGLWRLIASRSSFRVLLSAGLIGVAYLGVLLVVPMQPEERLHFVEYGVVAALLYLALRERRDRLRESQKPDPIRIGRWPPALVALLLTISLGWIDEGIQAVLPNRVYDLRDVVFNGAAGLMSVVALELLNRVRSRE